MKAEAFDNVHILIVDGKAGNARLLRGIFLALGVADVTLAEDTDRALELLTGRTFQAVFCDEAVGPLDAATFVRAVRCGGAIANPRTPILMTADALNRAQVEMVRDAGVNDLIVRPLTTGGVKRKLLGLMRQAKGFAAENRAEAPMSPQKDLETWEV